MASQSPHSSHAPGGPSASPAAQLPRSQNGSSQPIPPQYALHPLPPVMPLPGLPEFQGRPPSNPPSAGPFRPDIAVAGRMIAPHLQLAEPASPVPALYHTVPSSYSPGVLPAGARNGLMPYVGANGSPAPASNGAPSDARPPELAQPRPVRNGAEASADIIAGLKGLSVSPVRSMPQSTADVKEDIQSYIYNAGFVHAAWADTFLSISPHTTLRLHALIIARSPLLYQYLSSFAAQGPPYSIHINDSDQNLSTSTISMALATLYGQPLRLETPTLEIAKGLVAAGNLFVLDDVAVAGYTALLSLVTVESLAELLKFAFESKESSEDSQHDNIDISYAGPYPRYTSSLLSSLMTFLVKNMDHEFILKPRSKPDLRNVLVSLPFQLFKHVCESADLCCKSQMERYGFARDITGERERRRKKSGAGAYEEGVVLAFGGGKGGVEVIRKPIGKKKVLWKAAQ